MQGAADIPGYYHHGSRIAVGPSLMLTYNSKADAIAACKNMGNTCAGFSLDITTGKCEITPRGYALSLDASYDFYRKKADASIVKWETRGGVQTPSDIYDWYAKNGTLSELKDTCTPDQRCAGVYMCTKTTTSPTTNTAEKLAEDTCKHLDFPADGVLLKGVPAPDLLKVITIRHGSPPVDHPLDSP